MVDVKVESEHQNLSKALFDYWNNKEGQGTGALLDRLSEIKDFENQMVRVPSKQKEQEQDVVFVSLPKFLEILNKTASKEQKQFYDLQMEGAAAAKYKEFSKNNTLLSSQLTHLINRFPNTSVAKDALYYLCLNLSKEGKIHLAESCVEKALRDHQYSLNKKFQLFYENIKLKKWLGKPKEAKQYFDLFQSIYDKNELKNHPLKSVDKQAIETSLSLPSIHPYQQYFFSGQESLPDIQVWSDKDLQNALSEEFKQFKPSPLSSPLEIHKDSLCTLVRGFNWLGCYGKGDWVWYRKTNDSFETLLQPQILSTYHQGGQIGQWQRSPAHLHNLVFDQKNLVYADSLFWSSSEANNSFPAQNNSKLSKLTCVEKETGIRRWELSKLNITKDSAASFYLSSNLVLVDSQVWFLADAQETTWLNAVDLNSGIVRASIPLFQTLPQTPEFEKFVLYSHHLAWNNGSLYVLGYEGTLAKFDPVLLQKIWIKENRSARTKEESKIIPDFVKRLYWKKDSILYVDPGAPRLIEVEDAGGKVINQTRIASSKSSILLSATELLVVSHRKVAAYDVDDLEVQWENAVEEVVSEPILFAGDVVLVPHAFGLITAIDKDSGRKRKLSFDAGNSLDKTYKLVRQPDSVTAVLANGWISLLKK